MHLVSLNLEGDHATDFEICTPSERRAGRKTVENTLSRTKKAQTPPAGYEIEVMDTTPHWSNQYSETAAKEVAHYPQQ